MTEDKQIASLSGQDARFGEVQQLRPYAADALKPWERMKNGGQAVKQGDAETVEIFRKMVTPALILFLISEVERLAASAGFWGGALAREKNSGVPVQDAWLAAGGNPAWTPTRDELLAALRAMDEAIDAPDTVPDGIRERLEALTTPAAEEGPVLLCDIHRWLTAVWQAGDRLRGKNQLHEE